jgi:hypothetical protein
MIISPKARQPHVAIIVLFRVLNVVKVLLACRVRVITPTFASEPLEKEVHSTYPILEFEGSLFESGSLYYGIELGFKGRVFSCARDLLGFQPGILKQI